MSRRALAVLAAAALAACATANVAIDRNFDFSRVRRVAVVGFKDYPKGAGSGDMAAAAFERALIKAGYDVVERDEVAKVLKAQKYAGALDARAAKAIGGVLGVDALVLGQVSERAEPRATVVNVDIVEDRTEPVYSQRLRRVQQADGSYVEVSQPVITGYRTSRVRRKEPRRYSFAGKLGLSARMVFVADGSVLWSGSMEEEASSFPDASQDLADGVLKAVKPTWPKAK